VVHVADASLAVEVCSSVTSEDRRAAYIANLKVSQEEQRRVFAAGKAELKFATLEEARAARFSYQSYPLAVPELRGVRHFSEIDVREVARYIDWSPLFWTWELKGSYPAIFENSTYGEQARELYQEATRLLETILSNNHFRLEAVAGLWPAYADGDDVIIFEEGNREQQIERLCFLRQQRERQGLHNYCLADFIAPKSESQVDYIGAFAVVCHGVESLAHQFERQGDDYQAIMVKALGDRLAEALAEYLHDHIRQLWGYGRSEGLSIPQMIKEEYRGIRPAPGYPACPDHTEKEKIWKLLNVTETIGLSLTENYAMTPASSVSGFYFSHPDARYFNVGKIDRDQVADYAERKGFSIEEVERWLSPNLGY
jgi:5-methyltetrahydrofolate--homocysteine methyltransferase